MTNDEANKVAQAIQPLDQFAANAPLGRAFHATWQQLYTQAIRDVAALVDKPVAKKASPK